MSKRILVCRIAWMDHYRGVNKDDKVIWMGRQLDVKGWWEVFNFEPSGGRYYGGLYLERGGKPTTIHLERLGAGGADKVDNVLVVWAAVRPKFGLVVVGWYDNATVFRTRQQMQLGNRTRHYYVTARTADSVLLDVDERLLRVPTGKGAMGQQNTWMPEPDSSFSTLIHTCVDRFRKTGVFLPERPAPKPRSGRAWQPDLEKRLGVERAAVSCVAKHYEKAGYVVESREKENVGWDLEARRDDICLKLEVKGLSGSGGVTELTPNEYAMSLKYRDDYRVCIVTNALSKPVLHVYHYSDHRKAWVDDDGDALGLELITVKLARLSI